MTAGLLLWIIGVGCFIAGASWMHGRERYYRLQEAFRADAAEIRELEAKRLLAQHRGLVGDNPEVARR